jgi:hypothetical protein
MLFHRKTQHEQGEARQVECELCHTLHRSPAHLRRHMRARHAGPAAPHHQCPHCSAAFRQRYSLQVHLRTHTGETPYSCASCAAQFKRRHHLQGHARVCAALTERRKKRAERPVMETVEFTLIEDTGHVTLLSESNRPLGDADEADSQLSV